MTHTKAPDRRVAPVLDQTKLIDLLEEYLDSLGFCSVHEDVPYSVALIRREHSRAQRERFKQANDLICKFYDQVPLIDHLVDESDDLSGTVFVFPPNLRFSAEHVETLKRCLLYSDQIILHDPIYSLTRGEVRMEGSHPDGLMIEAAYHFCQIKRFLLESRRPSLILIPKTVDVFKKLETHDRASQLLQRILDSPKGDYLHERRARLREREQEWWTALGRTPWAPNERARDALVRSVRAHYSMHAHPLSRAHDSSDAELVFDWVVAMTAGIIEQIETATILRSDVCFNSTGYWKAYGTLAASHCDRLEHRGVAVAAALCHDTLRWLAAANLKQIATFREKGMFSEFRSHLADSIDPLHDATSPEELAKRFSSSLAKLLREHRRKLDDIKEEELGKHVQTAIASGLVAGAAVVMQVMPAFVLPLTGSVAVPGLMAQYLSTKVNSALKRRKARTSMVGILDTIKHQRVPP